ncbi:MAG TPA: M14 family metallopeptidase [Pseudonocardiaceae bacterium]|nr:M14 family metallopeptidase [Pseudonocardiaceae bacterium]
MSLRRAAVIVVLGMLVVAVPVTAAAAPPAPPAPVAAYRVQGVDNPAARTAVLRQGVDVLAGGRDYLEVLASPEQAERLRACGLRLLPLPALPPVPGVVAPGQFPIGYSGYHTYDKLTAELTAIAAARPDQVEVSSYGRSTQGRPLPLVKISDAVRTDSDKPEVLFSCAQHAREHLTVEMCLHIVRRLAQGYGTDPAITQLVRSREIWVLPMVNPDGAEYDISTGLFALWRKNRQPTPENTEVGTDLNRNWGTRWGCCSGSSNDPAADDYHGTAAFSTPETAQLRDWVNSRVIDGRQQITAHVDFHSFSELVLWPYGFTTDDTGPGLTSTDAAIFRKLGEAMAATNGYTAQQSSDLYVTDGTIGDWMWAQHHIWSYTFEMYPTSQAQGGFYPPETEIKREVERNDAAVDLLLGYADCVPRITGTPC